MTYLPPLINDPAQAATHAVIWLHGLGADGSDFQSLLPLLKLPNNHTIRFIFPHAKVQAVTINNGQAMPAWYDIQSADFSSRANEAGMHESVDYIHQLIEQQHQQDIDYQNIILAGFSQGGAVAIQAATNFKAPLNSVIVLSSYIAMTDRIPTATNHLPFFIGHGKQDNVVPFSVGKASYQTLKDKNYLVEPFHSYDMAHSLCEQEIKDISHFLSVQFTTPKHQTLF